MGSLKTAFVILLLLLVLGLYLYPAMTRNLLDSMVGSGKTITGFVVSLFPL